MTGPEVRDNTSARVVSPSRRELDTLRPPLQPGERLIFDFFDQHLAPEWELYVQPYLNGMRPDFVLLHPAAGIGVFEVKDWNLSACDWRIEDRYGRPVLRGTDASGRNFSTRSPFDRLREYRSEITKIYCPTLDKPAGLACVTAGLIFPFSDDEELAARFEAGLAHRAPTAASRRYFTLSGRQALANADLRSVFPDHGRTGSRVMSDAVAADLRHWLVEPDFAAEQRQRPELDREQIRFITTRTEATGYRRLRGPAGSGKTMVLAGRAAQLADEGNEVLVLSYNITLLNYLRDCFTRFGSDPNRITWLHFHSWCKRVVLEAGREDEYRSLPWARGDSDTVADLLADLTREALTVPSTMAQAYDAILIDEGQDFRPKWWAALRAGLRPGGEMLLVADRAQDLYGRNDLWTEDAMKGAGFHGPWATLDTSYRMPRQLAELTADFVERHLVDAEITPPLPGSQLELEVDPAYLRWIQTDLHRLGAASVDAIRTSFAHGPTNGETPSAFADLVFLTARKELGREVVARLSELGISVIHTFSEDERQEKRQKRFFFKGDARVKATTIHSFKGWEGRHLVIATGDGDGQRALSAVYAGLTRLKAHLAGSRLTVVCAAPELEAYGRTWPVFERDQLAP